MFGLQASLLDLTDGEPNQLRVHPLGESVDRVRLDDNSWVDLRPGWVTGSQELFEHLERVVPWRAERRRMYDAVVDVPRLTCFYSGTQELPHPMLDRCRQLLTMHYAEELGEPFVSAGLCLYRDGHDSVAWHGDRIGRSRIEDTMVAILSVGSPRTLSLRPNGGRTALRIGIGHGDLVVMGGACQREWEHAIPKTTRAVGARISIQFRVTGVR